MTITQIRTRYLRRRNRFNRLMATALVVLALEGLIWLLIA